MNGQRERIRPLENIQIFYRLCKHDCHTDNRLLITDYNICPVLRILSILRTIMSRFNFEM